ncbi:class II aldolase/adducin family protein [Candidatus Acetothermia bacterium]|nr:class II aldolase/adducin family protein [Candidatus Acetothermia bacterium]MCI2426540.1 class II aldolase/adducin family protein [Candidatus Acetothermia bacterium]MCI2427476.1 class II aldolase/adducin family protein [Candidatus Acetothermia bacterium]MCI2428647.1 class II aldolase/adducin family protein [Candidatus Acetothermia bacterium]
MTSKIAHYQQVIIDTARRMANEQLVFGSWGNISLRLDAEKILITPSGIDYDKIQREDIVLIDQVGTILIGDHRPSSELPLHLAIYNERRDVHAIVHTHSIYATSFAIVRKRIPPVVEDLVQIVGGAVEVAEYALPGTDELARSALVALADRNAVLLANHGVVGVAAEITEALKICSLVEKTAQSIIFARLLGDVVELSQHDIKTMHTFYREKYGQR